MTKPFFKILGLLFGIGLVIFLIYGHPGQLWQALLDFPADSMVGIALFTILANICQGLRYHFLWPDGDVGPLRQALLPFCTHTVNILLPNRSGDTVQPLLLRQWDPEQKFKSLIYWLLMDKFLEVVCFLPFLLATAWLFELHLKQALIICGLGWIGMIIWVLSAKNKPRNLFMAVMFSVFGWLFNLAVFVELIPTSIKSALGLLVGTSVASAIPSIPAGIGTYEMAFVWVGSSQGWTREQAIALAISSHTISILVTMLVGIPLALYWGWPTAQEHAAAKAQVMPLRHRISNVVVFFLAVLVIVCSGVLWMPYSRKKFASN